MEPAANCDCRLFKKLLAAQIVIGITRYRKRRHETIFAMSWDKLFHEASYLTYL